VGWPADDCRWDCREDVHLRTEAVSTQAVAPCYSVCLIRDCVVFKSRNSKKKSSTTQIHFNWSSMANTKSLNKEERKKAKRAARKKATPKAKRTAPRGSEKRKVKKMARGTAKR
jgi:hypothetical protein